MSPIPIMRPNPELIYERIIKERFRTPCLPRKFVDVNREFLFHANLNGKITPFLMDTVTNSHDDAKSKINRSFEVVTQDEK